MGAKNIGNTAFKITDIFVGVALLGIVIALVFSLINPVEQANRSRDTEYIDAASAIVSMTQKYLASHNMALAGFQNAASVGGGFLESDFRGNTFITKSDDITASIYVGKKVGRGEQVFACFIPLSNSVRTSSCAEGNIFTLNEKTGERNQVSPQICSSAKSWQIATLKSSWMVCLPK